MARRKQLRDSVLLIQNSDFIQSPLRRIFQSLGVLELQVCKPDQLSKLGRSVSSSLVVVEAAARSTQRSMRSQVQLAKRYFPSAPVIVVSSRSDLEEAVEAIRSGADDYLKVTDNVARYERAIERAQSSRHQPVDETTGLYNAQFLKTVLDSEIDEAKMSGRPLTLIFADLDRFKQVNDRYGHTVGTKVLGEVAQVFKKQLRGTDKIFRYGGDEFVAVLGACDLETATRVAERIRQAVDEREFLRDEGYRIRVSTSIGVALFGDSVKTRKSLIDRADEAMYLAKKKKGNRVEIASARRKIK